MTQSFGSLLVRDVGERAPALAGCGGSERGWSSHTFGDGVRSIVLQGPLDAGTAGRLWARISQLIERGGRRLVLDATAIEPAIEEATLLAALFAGRRPSYEAVVVAAPGSPLHGLLPAWVGIATSLTDARRQLATGMVRTAGHGEHGGRGPAGAIPAGERHALAVRQSLRWAQRSAHEGDFENALAWLASVESTEGELPARWQQHRQAWLTAWREQGDERTAPSRGSAGPSR